MGRSRRAAAVAACAAAALLTAGPAPAGSGLVRRSVGDLPVTVALPGSWQYVAVPASLTPQVVARLVAKDPVASFLASPYAAQAGIRFLGNEHRRAGRFTANVNLIVKPLPRGVSLREWFFAGPSAAMQYAGTTTAISSHGVPGLHYESTRAQKSGTAPLFTDVYAFAYDGRVFSFTYTSLAAESASYRPDFTRSGESIRFASS